jgi:F0F1-type ATP synthase assembly protein I
MREPLKPYFHDALVTFGRMSGWVAGPVVIALLAGKWLDKKYLTEPYFLIGMVGVGFFVSVFGILRESKKYIRMVDEKDKIKANVTSDDNVENSKQ